MEQKFTFFPQQAVDVFQKAENKLLVNEHNRS